MMVAIASRTVMENISWLKCTKESPRAASISENSEIWARDIAVKKDVLFLYPKNDVVSIVIMVLAITVSKIKAISGFKMELNVPGISCIPSETKNITEKKSLNGFILPIISIL